MIEVDSLSVIQVINSVYKLVSTSAFNLIEDYRLLLQLLGNPTIRHIYKEVNVVDDFAAKNAIFTSNDLAILDTPPDGLYIHLMYKNMGHSLPRLVNILP